MRKHIDSKQSIKPFYLHKFFKVIIYFADVRKKNISIYDMKLFEVQLKQMGRHS